MGAAHRFAAGDDSGEGQARVGQLASLVIRGPPVQRRVTCALDLLPIQSENFFGRGIGEGDPPVGVQRQNPRRAGFHEVGDEIPLQPQRHLGPLALEILLREGAVHPLQVRGSVADRVLENRLVEFQLALDFPAHQHFPAPLGDRLSEPADHEVQDGGGGDEVHRNEEPVALGGVVDLRYRQQPVLLQSDEGEPEQRARGRRDERAAAAENEADADDEDHVG